MQIERLSGRKSKALNEMINEPVIIELKNGLIYGGYVDDYETGAFWLYDCKLLDKKKQEWINHGFLVEYEVGKIIEDPMPGFLISEVKDVFITKSRNTEELSIEDVMQFYIDPHHKSLKLGIDCNYNPKNKKHSSECDGRLHEALICLNTRGILDRAEDKHSKELRKAFRYVRRRLLMYGAKIP